MKKLLILVTVFLLFGCSSDVTEADDVDFTSGTIIEENEEVPVYQEETYTEVEIDIAFIHPSFDTSIPDSYEKDWLDVVDFAYRNDLEVGRYTVGFFQDDGELEETIEEAIQDGATHIVLKKLLVIEEYTVLSNYPEISFLTLDKGYAFIEKEKREYPENVYGVYYLEHEIAFMAGVLAVAGDNDHIGIVTATASYRTDILTEVGFRAGVLYAANKLNKDVEIYEFDYTANDLVNAEKRNAILYEVEERGIDVVYTQLPIDLLSKLEQETDINSVPHIPSAGLYTYQTNLVGAALEKLIFDEVDDARIFVGIKTDSIGYGSDFENQEVPNEDIVKLIIQLYKSNEFVIPENFVELDNFIVVNGLE